MNPIAEYTPTADEMAFLGGRIFRYNCGEVAGYAYEDFIVKFVDDAEAIVAGIHCRAGGGWLYIASLWVGGRFRRQGLGSNLLARAEQIAVEKKCAGAYLYTYSFQSPGFYEKSGYRVFGELEDFFDGHSKFYMKKRLA